MRLTQPGEMLFVSAQAPQEVPQGQLFLGPVGRQAELVFGHIRNLVQDARLNLSEVVQVTIYLTDLKNETAVNQAYQKLFVGLTPPARVLVEVAGLRGGAGIEASAIAIRQAPPPPPAAPPGPPGGEEEMEMY